MRSGKKNPKPDEERIESLRAQLIGVFTWTHKNSSQSSRTGSDSACSVVRSRSDCIISPPPYGISKASRDSPKDSHQAPEELAIIVPSPAHCIHSSDVMWSNSISPEPYQSVPRPIRIAHVVLYENLDIPESDAMFRRIPITSHLSQTRGWNGYYLSGDQLQEYFVNFAKEHDLEQFINFETKVGRRLKVFRPTDPHPHCKLAQDILEGQTCRTYWGRVKRCLNHSKAGPRSTPLPQHPQLYHIFTISSASASSMVDRNGRLLLVDCVRSIHAMDNPSSCMARSADDPEKSAMPAPAGKHFYTEEEKNLFRTDPEKFLEYRKKVAFPWLVVDRRLEKTSWKLSLKTTPESYLAKSAGSQKQESK
ncbi:hypothetical protein DTO212C5_9211 [Paecilomyces variotii]|nr:hypothetical protein DTO212C5_9211 [Paecilomyces variotii]